MICNEAEIECAREIIQFEIQFSEIHFVRVWLDHDAPGVSHPFGKPHRVKGPVTSQLDHRGLSGNILEYLSESAFFLWLVNTFVFDEEVSVAIVIVAAQSDL